MMWTKEKPSKEGWYFWKARKPRAGARENPWKWKTFYYIPKDEDDDSPDTYWDGSGGTYWEAGTAMSPPNGGWWVGTLQTYFEHPEPETKPEVVGNSEARAPMNAECKCGQVYCDCESKY